jgi:hypothetical protein
MTSTIIPVGQFIGAFSMPAVDEAHQPQAAYSVRLGTSTLDLNEQEFGVWVLARGLLEDQQKPVSAASLRSLVRRADLDDATPTIAALIARRLLTRVMPVGQAARQFCEAHQLMPLGVGLGNNRAELLRFTVGNPEFPRAHVTAAIYDLWAFSALSASLWLACEQAAKLDEEISALDLAKLVVQALPALLATDAAYIDVCSTTLSGKTS